MAARDELAGIIDKDRLATTPTPASSKTVLLSHGHSAIDDLQLDLAPRKPKTAAPPVANLTSSKIPVVRGQKFVREDFRVLKSEHEYYAYTTEYDEVLEEPQTLKESKDVLSQQAELQVLIDRASRSHRTKTRAFVGRLSALAEKPVVTLLLDNSGSMRGKPIAGVASWTTVTSEILQLAGVPHEIIGFTTRAWKGGKSQLRWISDRRPRRPGRLNDIRYLIYKSASSSYQEALPNLGMMLGEGILKENIDGEAILFAFDRLATQEATRRMIFVVSDGAPVDDSTQAHNPPSLLARHAQAAVKFVRSKAGYEIYGIGVGHDASLLYGPENRVTFADGKQGSVIPKFVCDLILARGKSP